MPRLQTVAAWAPCLQPWQTNLCAGCLDAAQLPCVHTRQAFTILDIPAPAACSRGGPSGRVPRSAGGLQVSLCVNVCVKTVMLVCRMLCSGRPRSVVAYLGAVRAQRASVGWPNPHPAHLGCCCAVGNRNKPSGTATVDPVQLAAFHSRPHSLSIGTGLVPHSLWTGAALLTGLAAQPLSTQSSWRRPPMRLKPRQRLGRRRRRAALALWTCPARRVSTQYNCCLVGSPTAAAGVGLAAGWEPALALLGCEDLQPVIRPPHSPLAGSSLAGMQPLRSFWPPGRRPNA